MSKDQQKKLLQINHAISGYHGEQLKHAALQIYETRKDILKRLERKKKLAPVIYDQLYSYLQKFPEQVHMSIRQKMGLHQQSFKKKKAKLLEADEKVIYTTPTINMQSNVCFSTDPKQQLTKLSYLFANPLLEVNSEDNQ